jgi:assimilatory nitrate reductase catalytic subunit
VFKAARVEGDTVIAVRLMGETAGEEWLKNMMVQGASAEAVRPWVLAPVSTPPRGTLNRGRIVCNCLDVSETEIRRELGPGVTLEQLQARLKCGTECGSCLPELKKMYVAQELLAAS